MKLTMLGTGTGLIQKKRRSPAVLIETADGDSVIVDCGWGVPGAIVDLGFDVSRLTHLAITHRHADHMSAVPALLQSQLIANIPHLPGKGRTDKLVVHGYPGITEDLTTLCAMMIPELDVKNDIVIQEHSTGHPYIFDSLTISAKQVRHVETMPAVSFCIEAEGKKVVVTGDLGWDESVLALLEQADLVVMDASASQAEFEAEPIRSHLAPIQCGELAARARVRHLVLTSLYDRESAADITAAVRHAYRGTITIPEDSQILLP